MSRRTPLVRVALHLQDALRKRLTLGRYAEPAALSRLRDNYERIEQIRGWLHVAGSRGWSASVDQLRGDMLHLVTSLQGILNQVHDQLERPLQQVPGLRELLEDLQQLDDEFDGLHFDLQRKLISVTTTPIELEGIKLGRFAIQLFVQNLAKETGSDAFVIAALEPNPASSSDHVTHPHVNRQTLCAGDASMPIMQALTEGRLCDAICLVRSVLTTYNESSPHVALEHWHGNQCADCGVGVHADNLCYCERCGEDYCGECISHCQVCDESRCQGCMLPCPVCEDHVCRSCMKESACSDKRCCPECLEACPECEATVLPAELDDEHGLCPACLEAAMSKSNSLTPAEPTVVPVAPPTTETFHASTSSELASV